MRPGDIKCEKLVDTWLPLLEADSAVVIAARFV